jgi:carboxyl-terminal processing protease
MRHGVLRAAGITFALGLLSLPFAAEQETPKDDMRPAIKKFTQVYQLVEQNFSDKINPDDAIYDGAIPSMLHTLDPHSNFLDPKAYQRLQEEQAGHYFGVGMMVGEPEGKAVVIYPFESSPAFRAGLRPGDQITSVDDKSTVKLDVEGVSALLKGPQGTQVTVQVKRNGADQPLWFHLTRAEVPRDSVNYYFWLKPGIAFVKIDSFNENTGRELGDALAKLGESDIRGLVLDLRNNPGGILQEAVAVCDHFLKKGQGIVSHHGRASAEVKFSARHGERSAEYPIVILVNRGTASAAEIVSGALQDHDRAWILGEKTFGKGLVQAPYPLSGDTALLLTIAHYYTPSGRLIQRDYTHQSFYDYYMRGPGKDNLKDARKTDSGRQVYGGDGITPDEGFKYPEATGLEVQLTRGMVYSFFAWNYFGPKEATLPKDWRPDDTVLASFRAFASKRGVRSTDEEWKTAGERIRERLREELWITAFSKEKSDRLALENDPEVAQAVRSLPSSQALLARAMAVAERTPRAETVTR